MGHHILDVIRREGVECRPCERVTLDTERNSEYRDSGEHPAEALFERPPLRGSKKRVDFLGDEVTTILRFFLDGSRRTYKVADVIKAGRYLPLIAAQVGVAVVQRHVDGTLEPLRQLSRLINVLAFPDLYRDDLPYLQEKLNRIGLPRLYLICYQVKEHQDPVDLAMARIIVEMQRVEVETVGRMVEQRMLASDRLLVIDGPLRFGGKLDIVQFRNVVGVSKTFRPSVILGKRGRQRVHVGLLTSYLGFGERTSVLKATIEQHANRVVGMWYLRLREPRFMANPLEGILKMECYGIDPEDKEGGLDSERIDTISAHVLRDRNVTAYGKDTRWASHLYPVYLAETYIKASFMSDTAFKALF